MHPYRGLRTSLFPSIRGVYVQAFQQHEIVKRRTEIGGSRSGDTRWGPSLSAFPLLDAPSLRAYEARGDSYPKDCRSSYALSLAGDFRRGQSIRGYTVRSSILFARTLSLCSLRSASSSTFQRPWNATGTLHRRAGSALFINAPRAGDPKHSFWKRRIAFLCAYQMS